MFASRNAARSTRMLQRSQPLRSQRVPRRFQSTNISSSSTSSSSSHALIGGVAGGAVALGGCYAWYHFSGAKTLVNAAHETKDYFQTAQKRLTEQAPNPNEALRWLRQVSTYYAGFIPGASGVVNSTMDDLDKVHEKHKDEVDKIIQDAYTDLQKVSEKGMNMAAATQAWEVLQTHMKRIGELAVDASQDILNNHPEIKKKVGGSFDQLKDMGDKFGPEAKKQVDETWEQVKDIAKTGVSSENIGKIRKLVDEKVQALQKMGDEAWKKGLEKAKPYLDKNPKIKELVEKNADSLKQGNVGELYEKVKSAVESGDTSDLEGYVKDATSKAKDAAGKAKESGMGGFDQLLKKIPGGDQVLPQIQNLQEIAEKHGDDAKKLLDETIKELSQVLNNKVEKAKDIAKEAEKKAK
ncbi:hypothetical protein BT63DRAFT_477707 [Microthyrium microscopicum]|uniref:Apolipoprotein/apolipophorin n=1 Tax=Microthyrium microscopicum TaxID=703497 RepID=A0A6A6UHL0_9PEZI|nr:hypothetical protein BT63DRAFT_477707 [Microthyrium microscopicum]